MLVQEENNLNYFDVGVDSDSALGNETCLGTLEVEDESFIEDFSGCSWSSTLPEYPSWTGSFEETLSDSLVLQDLSCLPDIPLSPSYEVISSTMILDNNVEGTNDSVCVETSESTDTAKVETVEYSSSACECCLCNIPKFLVIPDVLCNSINMNSSNHSSCPVVTLYGKNLLEGYFSNDNISSNVTKLTSSVDEVRGDLRERYRIPRNDPIIDPSSTMRKFSDLETMSYLNALFLDIIPKNLSAAWSRIIKRDVRAPERFAVTSATAQEMLTSP